MRKILLMIIAILFSSLVWADTVVVDGISYPRDPFLYPGEQIKIFKEIKEEFQSRLVSSLEGRTKTDKVLGVVEPEDREDVKVKPVEFPDVKVDAVLSSVDINNKIKRWVLINGRLLQEGDVLGKVRIDRIGNDEVVVQWMGIEKRIRVGEHGGSSEVGKRKDESRGFQNKPLNKGFVD